MRTALLIADGRVLAGPAPASEMEAAFKASVLAGGEGHARIELWTEDRGIARYQKFTLTEPKAEQAAGKKKKS